MLAALKSEYKKLLSVRSTYFVTGFMLILAVFLSVYVFGFKSTPEMTQTPSFLTGITMIALSTFTIFASIITILLVAHEYRYNTINYTFTAINSRLKVLFAKTVVALSYATVVGLAVMVVALFGTKLGLAWSGTEIAPQVYDWASLWWQALGYLWGYVFAALIIVVLVRGLVGSIVIFFVAPSIEQLLQLLLKDNVNYLPFHALDSIMPSNGFAPGGNAALTHLTALAVFAVYVLVLGVISTVIFVRRDANN